MKQVVFAILFTASVFTAFAQVKPAEDSVLNLMKEDLCTELGKIPASDFTAENFQMKLGMQMLGVFQKYNDDLASLYGEDYATNQTTTYEIGKKIGMKLGMSCKAFQEIIMNNPELVNAAMEKSPMGKMKEPKKKTLPVEAEDYTPSLSFYSCKVISYTPADVSYYTVTIDGKTKKLFWMNRFLGDDKVIANPKSIIGKTVTFGFKPVDSYDPKTKTYSTVDVIIDLNIKKSTGKFTPPKIVPDEEVMEEIKEIKS